MLGNDVVPRLSFRVAQEFQDHALNLLAHSKMPKPYIFWRLLVSHCCGTAVSEKHLQEMLNPHLKNLDSGARKRVSQLILKLKAAHSSDPDQHFANPMYPPGRIVYLRRVGDKGNFCAEGLDCKLSRRKFCKKRRTFTAEWASTVDFQEIIIDADMVMDHFPDRVGDAIASLATDARFGSGRGHASGDVEAGVAGTPLTIADPRNCFWAPGDILCA